MSTLIDKLLQEIGTSSSASEISDITLRHYIDGMPELFVSILYSCTVPHWFTSQYLVHIHSELSEPEVLKWYDAILSQPFIELDSASNTATMNTSFRETILHLFWKRHRAEFKRITVEAATFFSQLIEGLENEIEDAKTSHKKGNRLLFEYRMELIYHLLIADESEGIKQLIDLLVELRAASQTSRSEMLLARAVEQLEAGRASTIVGQWIDYWRGQLQEDAHTLRLLADRTTAENPNTATSSVIALANYSLSDILARTGHDSESWARFFKAEKSFNDAYEHAVCHLSLSKSHFSSPTPNEWLLIGLNLPSKPPRELIGRNEEISNLVSWIEAPEAPSTLLVFGLGGIGKTALAHTVARRALTQGLVQNVFWTSAKEETFVEGHIREMPDRGNFQNLISSILQTAVKDSGASVHGKLDWHLRRVGEFLSNNKSLVVIDNIETLRDFTVLENTLPAILGGSKAILTGRRQFYLKNSLLLKLKGINTAAVGELASKGAFDVDPGFIEQVGLLSGGHPLLISFAAKQLESIRNPRVILDAIRSGEGAIFEFIFKRIWKDLSELSKYLVGIMASSYQPVNSEFLQAQSSLSRIDVETGLAELESFAFVRKVESTEKKLYDYEIDTLTRILVARHHSQLREREER